MNRRRSALAFGLAITVMIANGCYSNPDPTEWNADAHNNFVNACTTSIVAENGTTTTSLIASKITCECVYELIKAPETGVKGKYAIAWADIKDYEEKQAGATPGADPPTPPQNLTKALAECATEGPGV